jgi:hypothetical protein
MNKEMNESAYKSNGGNSIVDQIQQIVGSFPTSSKGKNMLDAVYRTE